MRTIVGVMGSGRTLTAEARATAMQLGRLIAERGWVLLTGGSACGVMDAASQGAHEAGGLVVGVLKDADGAGGSAFVDIAIKTGMGDARNVINVLSSDVVVALPGGAGTVSEVALALKSGRTVVALGWDPGEALRGSAPAARCCSPRLPKMPSDLWRARSANVRSASRPFARDSLPLGTNIPRTVICGVTIVTRLVSSQRTLEGCECRTGGSMPITRRADYAIRLMYELAQLPADATLSLRDLCEAAGVPVTFGSPLVEFLADAGLVRTTGYRDQLLMLAAPPAEITMAQIVRVADPQFSLSQCTLDTDCCSRMPECGVNRMWRSLEMLLWQRLEGTSLAHVVAGGGTLVSQPLEEAMAGTALLEVTREKGGQTA